MLIGEYAHTLDVKGRVNFPAKLLTDLGDRFILSKGLDGCLFVYSAEEWGNLERKIKELPLPKSRPLQRYFFAGAAEVEVDKQGRIVIPQKLREHAGLEKDVMIIGASSRAEIWDKERWNLSCEELTAETIESAMEELGF